MYMEDKNGQHLPPLSMEVHPNLLISIAPDPKNDKNGKGIT
jgi:hypothetical protein